MCLTHHLITWKHNNNEYKSPLILFPLHFKYFKSIDSFQCYFDTKNFFINPFFTSILKQEYSIDFQTNEENEFEFEISRFFKLLDENYFQYSSQNNSYIGNFHYHRFEILKDLEEISKKKELPPLLNILLGNEECNCTIKHKLDSKNLLRIDSCQQQILEEIEHTSLIVQGPPGTGKSHLLCNVVGKLLHHGSFNLVLSEKKTALDVIYENLKEYSLDRFSFLVHYNSKSSEFIEKLKNNWSFFENQNFENQNTSESKLNLYINKLDLFTDWYKKQNIFNYFSINELNKLENELNNKYKFIDSLPNYSEWIKIKDNLELLDKKLNIYPFFSFIKIALVGKNKDEFTKQFSTLKDNFLSINEYLKIYSFSDLKKYSKLSIYAQLYENEKDKTYFKNILSKEKRKQIEKEYFKWNKLCKELELWKAEINHWKVEPSISLVSSIIKNLKNKNKLSYFIFKKKTQKLINNKLVNLDTLCLNSIKYLKIKEQVCKIEQKLNGLGIISPELEATYVYQLCKKLDASSDSDWKTIIELTENERKNIVSNSNKIRQIEQNLNLFFNTNENVDINTFLNKMNQYLPIIIKNIELIKNIPKQISDCIREGLTIEEINYSVIKTEWIKCQMLFPEFSSYKFQDFKNIFQKIKLTIENEKNCLVAEIITNKNKELFAFNNLLRQSSSKLNENEKELKKRLKEGKNILIKEFSKKKSHKSILELLQSDAKLWIEILCPIFFSTSTVITKNFPLKRNLFKYLLVDEASQLLFSYSIPALYRSQKAIIVGDEQQMSPSSYFKKTKSSNDLLHQASYYLKKKTLTHHYRSKNPTLINFSNNFFYENKLLVYPSFPIEKSPINWVYCKNGRYENRENSIEAKGLIKVFRNYLKSNKKIGIVCFSEKQLSCVFSNLTIEEQLIISDRIKNNTIFFKSLEQVQGDECDILLISFAYGKDKNNNFYQHFGPLNHNSGAKRLNVLFSRAKEKIILFTSVQPSDFPISLNESVNLFRQFLLTISKNHSENNDIKLPYKFKFEVDNNKIICQKPFVEIQNPLELYVFYDVMKERNWDLEFEF